MVIRGAPAIGVSSNVCSWRKSVGRNFGRDLEDDFVLYLRGDG